MQLGLFLQRSAASAAFRDAVHRFVRSGRSNEAVVFDRGSPPVKVERALTKLLETAPELVIERVEIRGSSGCEFYRGELTAHTPEGSHTVRFHWDCKWKAEEQGWTDCFGFPDQIRAARVFGYDCFRAWEPQVLEEPVRAMA